MRQYAPYGCGGLDGMLVAEGAIMALSKVGRSYVVILKEEGVHHAPVVFPCDVTPPFIVRNFEHEGYEVLDHETTETPDDEKHIATFTLTVRRRK